MSWAGLSPAPLMMITISVITAPVALSAPDAPGLVPRGSDTHWMLLAPNWLIFTPKDPRDHHTPPQFPAFPAYRREEITSAVPGTVSET